VGKINKAISFLKGRRFDKESNIIYKLPYGKIPKANHAGAEGEIKEAIDFGHEEVKKILVKFISHHKERQVPRLEELKRYYMAENNIKYREPKRDPYRADNRIASDFAKFITVFNRGVVIGNPIKYAGDDLVLEELDEFNLRVNEHHHNQLMCNDCFMYGRAYEQTYRNEYAEEWIAKLDVMETFVVYDESIGQGSLFAVHYYDLEYLNKTYTNVEVYTNDGRTLLYECEGSDFEHMQLKNETLESQGNYFDAVTITEWRNNEERTSDFEAVLDIIDAYDLSQSELANFQQDSTDAYLVIEGNPATMQKKDGKPGTGTLKEMREARMLILGDPTVSPDGKVGPAPKAYYLIKEYDSTGAEAYKKRLVADILRFTFLIDFTDENLGGNNTGIGMRFKGWGNDNMRKTKERLIEKAIKRRIRLLGYSWSLSKGMEHDKLYQDINDITIQFTPNIPQNDTEIMTIVQGLDAVVSNKTVYAMAAKLTGVSPDEEGKRIKEERKDLFSGNGYVFKKQTGEVIDDEVVENG